MPILIFKTLKYNKGHLEGVTYGQRNYYKMVVPGNTEHQLYTPSLLLFLRQGAGIPLDCFNTCNQHLQGILILPSTGHAV